MTRVTVEAPGSRIDVALPDAVAVAFLLPDLLRRAGAHLADDGERHGGWVLHRATGQRVRTQESLGAQEVRDGEVLYLVPGRTDWPEPEYDDIVDVVVAGARQAGAAWDASATRRCAFAAATVAAALGALGLTFAGGPRWLLGLVGLAFAFAGIAAATALVRANGDLDAAAAVAGSGLPFAFVGGALLTAPRYQSGLIDLESRQVLLGSAALVVSALAGQLGVGARTRVFAAGAGAGLLGVVAGVVGLLPLAEDLPELGLPQIAGIVWTVAVALIPGCPFVAMRLGRVPVPSPPRREQDARAPHPSLDQRVMFDAVIRTAEIRTGLLIAISVVCVVCAWALVLASPPRTSTILLTLVGSLALLLHARQFPTVRERLSLLAGGGVGLVLLAVAPVFARVGEPDSRPLPAVVPLLAAAVCVAAFTAGLLFTRREPSPHLGRIGDLADIAVIVVLLPLACGVAGLFDYVQHVQP
ncbi:type VII secretion integral membrane protein EccD [Frankia sp. QA3]|uniref:type VII secretion integral membrane protein EccD n=1 Tax=Frankia sp. QA3 TaxID=710111 RepID=UPI0006879C12|nr:type VII secretion integral membrane protein EccD [Frankia sp. QA3]